MEQRYRFMVKRVYRRVRGSPLRQAVTASVPGDGDSVEVESVADYNEEGGNACFEYDTSREEPFKYRGVDEARDLLLGVTRDPDKRQAHADGTFVQEGRKPSRARQADGYLEDEDHVTPGIRIPNYLAHYFDLGVRRIEDMEQCWVEGDETGLSIVDPDLGLPIKAVFSWLPPTTVGDKTDAPYPVDIDSRFGRAAVRVASNVTGSPLQFRFNLWRDEVKVGFLGDILAVPVGKRFAALGGADLARAADAAGGRMDLKDGDFITVEFISAPSMGGSITLNLRAKP